jgi:hypothetical protein
LNGVTAVSATSGGGEAALRGDLLSLVGAITSGDVTLIANAKTRLAIQLLAPFIDQQIWVSAALADGVIIAIDPNAFASGFGPEPRITASVETAVQLDDAPSTQLAYATGGSPASAISAPVRSAFQTDCIVIRITLDVAYALRAAGAVAWLTGATWD